MAVFSQLVMNSLIAGSIYALIASGFSLMYGLQKFMNVAHGATYIAGAFVAYALWEDSIALAILGGVVCAMLLGVIVNITIFRKLENKHNALLLASFGVFLFCEAIVLLVFGPEVKYFPVPLQKAVTIFGASVTPTQLCVVTITPLIFLGLWWFLHTRTGKALRATADNKLIAKTMGINIELMAYITTTVGAGLAAIAGIMVGLEQNIEPTMGMTAILKGLTAAIIGGIGNVPAAILGGYLLGFAENFGTWYLPSSYKDAIAFVILIVFLLWRPQGFFGIKRREEVSA